MKKLVSLLVLLLVMGLAVCGVAEDKPFAGQTLTISTFSFNAELLQKNIYDPFEELTGCTLVVDSGNNAQRVTKIIESPEDYDVVMWEKHGVFAVGCDIMEAFDQVDVLNKSAQIYIAARCMGYEPDGMTLEQMKEMSVAFNLPK